MVTFFKSMDFFELLPSTSYINRMKRREILKYTALVTGAAVSAPLFSSLLVGCKSEIAENDVGSQLAFFSQEEFTLVKDLVDLILPKTDSPSASEVGIHQMIDTMVGTVYPEKDRAAYKKAFTTLAAYLNKAADGKNFRQLESDKQLQLLKQLEGSNDSGKAFLDLKQQTVAYYLSTEEIATNYLNYLPIPGQYDACITLEEAGGKAWAE